MTISAAPTGTGTGQMISKSKRPQVAHEQGIAVHESTCANKRNSQQAQSDRAVKHKEPVEMHGSRCMDGKKNQSNLESSRVESKGAR